MPKELHWTSLAGFGVGLVLVGWGARVLVHELGHAFALILMGHDSGIWLRIDLYSGFTSWHSDSLATWQDAIVSMAGILLVCLVAYLLALNRARDVALRRFLHFIAVLWVASEFVNATPIWRTDGNTLAGIWGTTIQWGLLALLGIYGAYLLHVVSQRPAKVRVIL